MSSTVSGRVRSYDSVLMGLHWLIVALLVVQYFTKLIPASGASGDALNAWHLAVGPTILVLMLLRLGWRLAHAVPPPPADLSPGLRMLSRTTHWAFYGVLILLPILGWLSASAFGATPYLLGLIKLPLLTAPNKAFAEQVGGVHGLLAWLLLALIALHVAGALYHAVIKRDEVLQRMLPLGEPGPS